MAALVRMDENSFRGREKVQPKMARKPLTDMTNSRKPLAKDRSSVKKVVQPKVGGRKPLGDVTNSNQQRVPSKTQCTETVSAVKKDQIALGEGFLHNHGKCNKANMQSLSMTMDYFLEVVSLKRDSAASVHTSQLTQLPKTSNLELDSSKMIDELEIDFLDFCAPPTPSSPPTPRSPLGSPGWNMGYRNLEPLRRKDSPLRG